MDTESRMKSYWYDIAAQNAAALKEYFLPDATVYWNNTNERFTVDEFITANCEYPGTWTGEIERIETMRDTVITVTRVWNPDNCASFHVTSFFELRGDRIAVLNEYWGDDAPAPQWRTDRHIGSPIKQHC